MSSQEEAKKLLPYVRALSEGMAVQWMNEVSGEFCKVHELDDLFLICGDGPRIVDPSLRIEPPEPTYRPYTRDECVEHCLGKLLTHSEWKCVMLVTAVTDTMVYNGMELGGRTFDWLLAKCTHLDGSSCGMKIEEESDARSY